MKKNEKLHKNRQQMRCPYCGSPVVFRSADGIYRENSKGAMLYVCSRYPECNAYVRAHPGSNQPMGSLADPELRTLRRRAHYYFDQLHKSGRMSRADAYRWLADKMRTPLKDAHIGNLREYYCKQVIEESRRVLGPQVKEKPERRGAS